MSLLPMPTVNGHGEWSIRIGRQSGGRAEGGSFPYHIRKRRSGVVQEDSLREQDANGKCGVAPLSDLDVELVVLGLAEHHYAWRW